MSAGRTALGYTSWSQYVEKEFGITVRRSYQLLAHGRVQAEIAAGMGTAVHVPEWQARGIKGHVPEVIEAAKALVLAGAPEAEALAQAVDTMRELAKAERRAKRLEEQRQREIKEEAERAIRARVEATRVAPDPTRSAPAPVQEAALNDLEKRIIDAPHLVIMSTVGDVGYDSWGVGEPDEAASHTPEEPAVEEPDGPSPFDLEEWKALTYRCPDLEQHKIMVTVVKATETRIKERVYKAELARRGRGSGR